MTKAPDKGMDHKVGLLTLLTVSHSLSSAPRRAIAATVRSARRPLSLGWGFLLDWAQTGHRRR